DRMGIEHVALGSDFDGATMPTPMGDCAGLPKLVDVLRGRGWSDDALQAMALGNWLRVLAATWR
ncbi:MAG: membrane dipeptidase, partial [Phycisphaerales bacterium]|nr:membrane dipeptidase [Phycisphaerales bacterium]